MSDAVKRGRNSQAAQDQEQLLGVTVSARPSSHRSDGKAMVSDHAAQKWDKDHGARLAEARINARESEERFERTKKSLGAAQSKLDDTKEWVRMNTTHGEADGPQAVRSIPPWRWNLEHQITGGSALVMAILLLVLGAINVVSAILSSGNPVFIENPWMAWILGGLVPAIAMAIKFGYHLFDYYAQRKLYAWAIYGVAGICALIWVVLFAVSFEGTAAGIDWDALGEESHGNGLASLLTAIQILTELFAGAALFLVVENCFAIYSASYSMQNPEWIEAEKALRLREADYEADKAAYAQALGTLETLEAARNVSVTEAMANWRSFQSGNGKA